MERGCEAGWASLKSPRPAGSSRHGDGHLIRAGQMAFTCSGCAPWCWGPWSCRDNNRQLPALGRGLRAFKGWEVCGERERLPCSGPPHPHGLPFVLRFVPPSLPRQHPSNKSVLIEDSSVLETTRKRLVECDLASPLSGLPRFVCACIGFCSKGQRSWTWIWCVPGVFFLFPFLAAAKAFGYF